VVQVQAEDRRTDRRADPEAGAGGEAPAPGREKAGGAPQRTALATPEGFFLPMPGILEDVLKPGPRRPRRRLAACTRAEAAFPNALTICTGRGDCTILLDGASGGDSLALLVCELSNGGGSQLGGDEQQLGQITRVLLLEAAPGGVAGETAVGDFAYVELLGWHAPRSRADGLNAVSQVREDFNKRDR
jgi:hypothetical protein